ncbi:uncharacterized protein PV06_00440 [Exophiala oligosperma]|uniref:Uncharacterized protein n=1 Tax=Exophiala oligosperma TaxID=215243 RepID=A0A0D2CCY4_9EURO|nr:uncharacterized protein PV06_00440 [Exophiala oligosperma]KIW47777.1 hypothetical protein PV06_00440 [Exophiala oligosperma]
MKHGRVGSRSIAMSGMNVGTHSYPYGILTGTPLNKTASRFGIWDCQQTLTVWRDTYKCTRTVCGNEHDDNMKFSYADIMSIGKNRRTTRVISNQPKASSRPSYFELV